MEIAVHWMGFNIDVTFWSQHISFYLVGCIVVTSIRGLLLTLTKVKKTLLSLIQLSKEILYLINLLISVFLCIIKQ